MTFTLNQVNKLIPKIDSKISLLLLEDHDRDVPMKLYDDGEVKVNAIFVHTKEKEYNTYLIIMHKSDGHSKRSYGNTVRKGITVRWYSGEGPVGWSLWYKAWRTASDEEKKVCSIFYHLSHLLAQTPFCRS
jgi:hypothetical protein